jgi:hypothetical protein
MTLAMTGPNGLIFFSVGKIGYLVSAGELILRVVIDYPEDSSFSDIVCLPDASLGHRSFLKCCVVDEV